MKKFWHYGKRAIIIILILGVVSIFFFRGKSNNVEYVTELVEKRNIKQIVAVNGTVEANSKMELKFQKQGKVSNINVKVGEQVVKGQLLGGLDADLVNIEIYRARAEIESAQADLNLRYAGPTNEEIIISEKRIKEAEVILKNANKKFSNTLKLNEDNKEKAELEVENAKISLENYEKQYGNSESSGANSEESAEKTLANSYENSKVIITDSLDAMQVGVSIADSILGIDNQSANDDFDGLLSAKDPSVIYEATNKYKLAKSSFSDAKADYEKLKDDNWNPAEIENVLQNAEKALETTKNLIDKVYIILDNTITDANFSQSQLDALKSNIIAQKNSLALDLDATKKIQQTISTAKLNLNSTAISSDTSVTSAKTSYDEAKNRLKIAQENLNSVIVQNQIAEDLDLMDVELNRIHLEQAKANHEQLIASPRNVDVAALKANLKRAQSSYDQALKNLENTQIYAPVDGAVTEINIEIGENVSGGETAFVVMNDSLQITADIAETDITKIQVDNEVEITLDAFPIDQIFKGKVINIDPAETVVQGVIYYQTAIIFESENELIKSGMTANLDILTASKNDTLSISPETLYYEENKPFVFKVVDIEKAENVEEENCNKEKCKIKSFISTGIEGEDAIEVKDGLTEGEEILVYEKE